MQPFVAQFFWIFFIMMQNLLNFVTNIIFGDIFHKMTKKIAKNMKDCGQWTLKFCVHKVKILYRKSLENTKIIWAALHCENDIWNKGRHPKKKRFFLGKSPKLWVGGGQES